MKYDSGKHSSGYVAEMECWCGHVFLSPIPATTTVCPVCSRQYIGVEDDTTNGHWEVHPDGWGGEVYVAKPGKQQGREL